MQIREDALRTYNSIHSELLAKIHEGSSKYQLKFQFYNSQCQFKYDSMNLLMSIIRLYFNFENAVVIWYE